MKGVYLADGAKLGFSDTGSGLPVVFLHPTPLDREYWRPLTRELAGIRAIVPDLRGHGVSELGSALPVGGFARVPDAPVLTMAQLGLPTFLPFSIISMCVRPSLPAAPSAATCCWSCGAGRRSACAASSSSVPSPNRMPRPISPSRAGTIALAKSDGVAALFDGMAQNLLGATARRDRPRL